MFQRAEMLKTTKRAESILIKPKVPSEEILIIVPFVGLVGGNLGPGGQSFVLPVEECISFVAQNGFLTSDSTDGST